MGLFGVERTRFASNGFVWREIDVADFARSQGRERGGNVPTSLALNGFVRREIDVADFARPWECSNGH